MGRRVAGVVRRLRPLPLGAVAVAALLVSVTAFGALSVMEPTDGRESGAQSAPSIESAAGAVAWSPEGVLDSDLDGIPDPVENFAYGTDPAKWNTSGSRLPDGWLIRFGYDPLDPSVEGHNAAIPPPTALPPAYGNAWPVEFRATLWDVYSWNRPADWNESAMGPFDSGLDPTRWDNNDDGVPDGWLFSYGLDPMDGSIGSAKLAGADGLTVKEAFTHDTDPRKVDTDGDGIRDAEEVAGPRNPRQADGGPARFPPTDPSAWSTAAGGVCDGYLVAHGLDPSEPGNSYRDLGKSGATTVEKFLWSLDRFGDDACETGAGLDPLSSSTVGGPIPDGWLMRYGLDPLDEDIADDATDSSSEDADGPWAPRTVPPEGMEELAHVSLTVMDEYQYGRPSDWDEASQGPWWGGTDPSSEDTDADGLPDAVEMRGFFVGTATEVGPSAPVDFYTVSSDPTRADTTGDGLNDYEEVVEYGTDPSKRDTDLDGIPDVTEVDLEIGVDPTRADSAGDYLLDGVRLHLLTTRSEAYRENPSYEFPGETADRKVTDWACRFLPGVQELVEDPSSCLLSPSDLGSLFGPEGDLDGDEVSNILDPDMDGDELLNGWEVDPALYRFSPFGTGPIPRPVTDLFNPDTDDDRLLDAWEVKHGKVVFVDGGPRRYSLDASAWDSLCNPRLGDAGCEPLSDADRDDDDDSIDWVRYLGSGDVVRDVQRFVFSNREEQTWEAAGALPNDPTSDGDGLLDGWKAFWGSRYENEDPGLFRPEVAGSFGIPADATRPTLGLNQTGQVVATGEYNRFVFDLSSLRAGEVVVAAFDVPLEGGGEATVHRVTGTVTFTFQDAQEFGTNPYLADVGTAGDGIPDWWKWHYRRAPTDMPEEAGCVSEGSLDPLDHEAWAGDLAGEDELTLSGLTLKEEYEFGTNPWCRSTTLSPFADGQIASFEGKTLDDLASILSSLVEEKDSDGDGIQDFDELLGGTNPFDPDSDGDGLLDGGNVVLDPDADAPWVTLFVDLGIAFEVDAGQFVFQGEEAYSTHPLNPDATGDGVPDGWLAGNHRNPKTPGGDFWTAYSFGMPPWWDLRLHGPWWGGVPPNGSPRCGGTDGDCDGLRDDGEDPMPGANGYNQWRPLTWTDYPASLELADPGVAPPTDPELDRIASRLAAQSYVNPRVVDQDGVSYDGSFGVPSRSQPCISIGGLKDATGQAVAGLKKGEVSFLHGRVYDCSSSSAGFHGVTVEVLAGGQAFGAGFTEADGGFRVPVNVSVQQSVEIPSVGPALVLRGQTAGTVNWTADPSVVEPGVGRPFTVRSYASPHTPPFTDDRPALASRAESVPNGMRVEADSRLSLSADSDAVTGKAVTVRYQLTDSGGTPLRDPVEFHWAGETDVVRGSTGADGRGEVTMAAPHRLAGLQTIMAQSKPQSGFVQHATADRDVNLRKAVDVQIDSSLPASVDAGTELRVAGHVVFQNDGMPAIPVEVLLSHNGVSVAEGYAETSATGRYVVDLPVPPDQARGEHVVVVTANQTATTLERPKDVLVNVRSQPRFTEVSNSTITQGENVTIQGRLVEPDGTAVPEAAIDVRLDDVGRQLTTAADGRFAVTVAGSLPTIPVLQTLSFAGDSMHTPVTHRAERAVLATTSLTMPGGELARGADVSVSIRLQASAENPVEGAPIWVTWGDSAPVLTVTGPSGTAVFHRPGTIDDATGPVVVRAEYTGSRDGGYGPSKASAVWMIVTKAEIVLPNGSYQAGDAIPNAILRDAGTGEPLARETVLHGRILDSEESGPAHAFSGHAEETVTDEAGRFAVLSDVNRTTPPGEIPFRAHFPGNAEYGAVTADSEIMIQTASTLEFDLPANMVVGRETFVGVSVQGLDGAPVEDGDVVALIGGETIGSGSVERGVARVGLVAPETAPPGPTVVRFEFDGSSRYAPVAAEGTTQLLRGVNLSLEIVPAAVGGTAVIRVTATSGGKAVPFVPVHVDVEGLEGGLRGMTDENGVATFQMEQPAGTVLLAARYAGEETLTPAHTTASLVAVIPPTPLERGLTGLSWFALALAIVLTVLAPVAYRLRRSPLSPIFRRTRRILTERGPDAQKIMEAYRDLEEATIGQRLMVATAPTPRSLQEVLEPHVPSPVHPALDRLIGLFEDARYTQDPIGPAHTDRAITALDEILHSLRAKAGGFRRRPKTEAASA